jgi:phage tail-like protein
MKLSEIEHLLPWIIQRTIQQPDEDPYNPLFGLLGVMEQMHEPAEADLASLHNYFNPYLAPDRFVTFLAAMVDLQRILNDGSNRAIDLPVGHLRELIAISLRLSKMRGTKQGLVLFLETATGVAGFQIAELEFDATGQPIPFHIRVQVPAQTPIRYRALIERIVEQEKPAYVTHTIVFDRDASNAENQNG